MTASSIAWGLPGKSGSRGRSSTHSRCTWTATGQVPGNATARARGNGASHAYIANLICQIATDTMSRDFGADAPRVLGSIASGDVLRGQRCSRYVPFC
jgi:hypothetical protein